MSVTQAGKFKRLEPLSPLQMHNPNTTTIGSTEPSSPVARTVGNICNNFLFVFLLLATIILLLYHGTLSYPFCHLDDPMYVTNNQSVLSGLTLDGVKYAFTDTRGFYSPVTWLSLMLDATIGKGRSTTFHATNLWLHILNSFLFYLLSRRLLAGSAASLLGAILFCVHPLSVESFVWISERKGLLATAFVLGALLFQLEKPGRLGPLVIFLYVCSFLSKPSAVLLPVWSWLAIRNTSARSVSGGSANLLRKPWIIGLLSVFAVLLTVYAENNANAIKASIFTDPKIVGADIFAALGLNLSHFFVPLGLAPYYPRNSNHLFVHLVFGALAAVFLGRCLLSKGCTTLRRLAVYWTILTYLPSCGAISIGLHLTADRYLYLPMMGMIWLLIDVLHSSRQKLFSAVPLVPATLCLMSGAAIPISVNTANRWSNEESIWKHTTGVTESNYVARIMLGLTYSQNNRIDLAIIHFSEAAAINPRAYLPWYNLGECHMLAANVTRARECYEMAVLLEPNNPLVLRKLGLLYSNTNHPLLISNSEKMLRRAVCIEKGSLDSIDDLSRHYLRIGNLAKAARVYRLYSKSPQESGSRSIFDSLYIN